MKVKATDKFNNHRLITLEGLSLEDFRALQQGKTVDVNKDLYESNKYIFEVVKASKGVKDGD